MARKTLVLDASVGVKWLSGDREQNLEQALAIREGHMAEDIEVVVPDLFYYEVINAVAHKRQIPLEAVGLFARTLFDIALTTVPADSALMAESSAMARRAGISVYDACYVAVAKRMNVPLVTANPRHQTREMGCEVIPIEEWRP